MKEIFNKSTKSFSRIKLFSDWDQIRDLVNDQVPKGVKKVEKVRGSETNKSYRVRAIYRSGQTKETEIPITGKDALGNYNRATRSKVENTANPYISEETKESFKYGKLGYTKEQIELAKRARNDNWEDRQSVAKNPNTPKEVLEKLADDKSEVVRYAVAKNPSTPKEVLEKLTNDDDWNVRDLVARNSSTPKEVLEKLAKDSNVNVRWSVARNASTPKELLEELASDNAKEVRGMVALNHNAPKEVLEKLAEDKSDIVRRSVAENPNYKSSSTN